MEEALAVLSGWAQAHGLLGVFLFMAAENVGVPVPTGIGFVVAQGLINHGRADYWLVFALISVAHLAGAGVSYYLGRAGDNALTRRFANSPRMMRARGHLRGWYARHGAVAILFGRLVGHVRPWASLVAGMSGVPPVTFWVWTVVGTLIFTPTAMWLTVWGWRLWRMHPDLRLHGMVALALIFYGAALWGLGMKLVQRHLRRRRLACAAAEVD